MALASSPLAIPTRRGFRWTTPLQWWHLLSFDAPTVAALWAWSFARAAHVALPWSAPLLLALGMWVVYVADRILDGIRREAASHLRERHFFYARHRGKFLMAGIAAVLVLIWLVTSHMIPAARYADTVLFAIALLYFSLIHLRGPGIERWLPKELAVGVLFAAATAAPAGSRLVGSSAGAALTLLVVLFALLCWLNCTAIEKWEHTPVASAGQAHLTTRWVQSHLRQACVVLGTIATIGCVVCARGAGGAVTALYGAVAISAALFFVLDRSELGSLHLRIAADLALLTPLLFLAVLL